MDRQCSAYKRLLALYRLVLGRDAGYLLIARFTPRILLPRVEWLEPRIFMSLTPSGTETVMAQYINGQQQLPAVAADSSGNIVAVWQSQNQDGSGAGIYARQFDSSGNPLGNEFLVNQTVQGDQKTPSIAVNASGDFVITWVSGNDVYARAFNANGTATTGELLAIAVQPNGQDTPSVAMAADGSFAVVTDEGANGHAAIMLQQFTSSGVAQGSMVTVNTLATNNQVNPYIAIDSSGNSIVSWTDQSSGAGKIVAQELDSSGNAVGSEFLVGTLGNNQEDQAKVAFDGSGNFVITWQDNFAGGSNWDVYARRYNAAGTALDANPVLVNTTTSQSQQSPSIAELPDGEYFIAWQSQNQDGDNWGIYGQGFNADGTPAGGEFRINTTTHGPQQDPTVAWGGSAAFVLWDGQGATINQGVFGQRLVRYTAANQAPIITSPYTQSLTEGTNLTFNSSGNPISISDPDGGTGTEQVTLSATNGTFNLASNAGLEFVSGNQNGQSTVTVDGLLANVNAALNGLVFVPAPNYSGPASLQITANDLGNSGTGGAQIVTAGVALTVMPIAHTPTVSGAVSGGAQTTNGLVITPNPSDTFSGYFKITGVTGGTLYQNDGVTSISTGSFITFAQGEAGLKFSPTLPATSNGSFLVQTSINNNASGLGGSVVTATITVNGPPVNNAPGAQTVLEDTALVFSTAFGNAVSLSDSGTVSVLMSATNGTMLLASSGGLTFSQGGSTYSSTLQFTGNLSNINNALSGFSFAPASHYVGSASISISNTSTTLSVGTTTNSTIPITVVRAAHTPSVTNATTVENVQSATGLTITPHPLDASSSDYFQITGITGGTLYQSNGVTAINDGDFVTTAQGLAGLRFMPSPNSTNPGSVGIQASTSASNGGLGGSVVTATITVDAPPTLSASGGTLPYTEEQGAVAIEPTLAITDSSSSTLVGATIQIVGYVAGQDVLNFTPGSGITGSWDAVAGNLTLSGTATLANYQSVLRSLTYTNTSNDPTAATLRVVQFTVNSGLAQSNALSRSIQITAVNDAPTIAVPGSQSIAEDAGLVFSAGNGNAITVGDVDADGASELLTLTATNGTVSVVTTSGLGSVSGNGSSSLSLTGLLTALNAAMDGLQFTPASHYFGVAGIAININDLGNTGTGGPHSINGTVPIFVNVVAHTPTIANAVTNENVQTRGGLVISPNIVDGSISGFFKITGITGGTLFQSDGLTPISNGQYITFAQGEAGLKFTPAANSTANGAVIVQASLSNSDAGLGGSTANAVISVLPVPITTVQGPQTTTEDVSLVFSSAAGNAITATDPGNSSGVVQIELSVTGGTLTLGHRAGITFTTGTGTTDSSMTFTGTFTAVNRALAGLRFTPALHSSGSVDLTVASTEGSNSAQSDVAIDILPGAPVPKPDSVPTPALGPAPSTGPAPAPSGDSSDSSDISNAVQASSDQQSSASSQSQKEQQSKAASSAFTSSVGPPKVSSGAAGQGGKATVRSGDDLFSQAQALTGVAVSSTATAPERSEPAFAVVLFATQITHQLRLPDLATRIGTIEVAQGLAFLNRGSAMWHELDSMKKRMVSDMPVRIWAGTASVVSAGVSVVYLLWIARAGSLLSSLLSSMPAWRLVDPLPILDNLGGTAAMLKRSEDDGLERLISDASGL